MNLLDRYAEHHPAEHACVQRIRTLVEGRSDCFERTCMPGHVTASAWILSPDRRRFLLTHHRKLGRWLQLGGHADGDPDVARTALREAQEESGLRALSWGSLNGLWLPVDLDVHRIPANGVDPEHEHHDVRFLLVAEPGQEIRVSDESHDLRWFELEELDRVASDESLHRLGRKVHAAVEEWTTRPAKEV